ncbi:MAG: helix-turn-helix domain-containing protein [Anaerobutyricum hallii]|uniref:helix-turn-helix domain-containing protein n=1 Tax=Anaerobutyricum hallii TaxID=39488 RepID=UPI0039956AEE
MEKIFGKALLEAREMTGISREDLSARTRMCVDTIKKYESEDANPSLKKIFRIADALGCGFGWDKNSFFFYPWMKTKDRADTFAEELKKVREDKGYSQKALAEKSGIKVATITGYETGKTCPSLKSMIKIAQTLNCTFGWDRSKIWFSKIKKKKTKKPVEQNYYSFNFD